MHEITSKHVDVHFVGTCVGLRAKDLHDFDDSSRQVTYRTFREKVGTAITDEINTWANIGRKHFLNDWHIRYYTGKWRGRKAVCFMHSSIHHIWTL